MLLNTNHVRVFFLQSDGYDALFESQSLDLRERGDFHGDGHAQCSDGNGHVL